MENRVTRLIVPILIGVLVYVLIQQWMGPDKKGKQDPTAQTAARIDPTQARKLLRAGKDEGLVNFLPGEPGKPGLDPDMHALGGSINRVELWDYFQSAKKEQRYEIIEPLPGLPSFVIEDFNARFPVKQASGESKLMGDVYWNRVPQPEEDKTVVYELPFENGLTIEKHFRFFRGSRRFQLMIRIRNKSKEPLRASWSYRLRAASVLSNPKSEYFMNPARVFAALEGDEEPKYLPPENRPSTDDYPDVLRPESGKLIAYTGTSSRFFTCIVSPADEKTANAIEAIEARSLPPRDNEVRDTKAGTNVAAILQVQQRVPAVPDDGGEGVSDLTFDIYLGPKSREVLESDEKWSGFTPVLDLDFEQGCFCEFPGVKPVAKVMLWILGLFHSIVGNWGIAIIMLTLVVRSIMMPLNVRQAKSMRLYSQKMQKLKPRMDEIKEKYKNNQQKMNKALVDFQREHKLFPPLMGCLPMLLTMPVFIGLFMALRASFELRHQPFMLWIQDLSLPDRLLDFGAHGIGFLPRYLNLLPLIMAALWILNAFNQPLPEDPQQRSMQRIMRFMPVMFLFFLYTYASGLALYFTVSALWSFIEQRIVKKKIGAVAMASPM